MLSAALVEAAFRGSQASLPEFEGEPALPRLIAGRYRIDDRLAEGGMGVVFRGWHVLLDQPIAIKFLKDEYAGNPEAVARFLREARATARLQGRHVAHVFDIGKIDAGTPFIVTELLNGSDLGKLLTLGPFPAERAVATLIAVCDAVLEVHAAGIVHRDLKPDNLFIVDDGASPHVKILDFGVARPLRSNLTRPERGVGSPQYMSPEQILTPQQVDFRSDVWSLGVVLYELLTARVPFVGTTIPDLCAHIVREDFIRPSNWYDMPRELRWIISKCLEKDRDARYASVAELRDALGAARLTQAVAAAPLLPPPKGRSGALLVLASVVAAGLSFAGVVAVFDRATAAPPRSTPRMAEASLLPRAPAQEQIPRAQEQPAAAAPASQGAPVVLPEGLDSEPDREPALACDAPAEAAASRSESVPLRAEPPVLSRPATAQPWLWIERNRGRAEVAHTDIVSPYPNKP